MGGATDSALLNGHLSTWEGSINGRIAQGIINAKCMNPIFYFDEIDKISNTSRGDELRQLMVNLIDPEQNDSFKDNYFAEFKLDISKCLFIFSYNDPSLISPILLNRIEQIETKGYSDSQKLTIGQKFLLPRILPEYNFSADPDAQDIVIPDSVMAYIIDKKVVREDGVRNLKRFIAAIVSKLNLAKLMDPDSRALILKLPPSECASIQFPYVLSNAMVDILQDKPVKSEAWRNLYV